MGSKWTGIKRILRFSLVMALIMMFGIGGLALTIQPGNAEAKVDVLVAFNNKPGSIAGELIENAGGDINLIYHVVPAVAASVPKSSLKSLRHNPEVSSIEEDTQVQILGNGLSLSLDKIRSEAASQASKGSGVKIAVLDTGIDLDHPDLAVAGSVTFVSGTTSGDDDNGHGTLVAGIIGARDNGIGVTGVAPGAAIYSVKVLDKNGAGLMSSILSGIQWARDNNMQVINLSFGVSMQMPSTIKDALDSAYNAGIVIVAGAGDGGNAGGTGNNVWYPARYESVIAVGATDNAGVRYASSSTGYQLEVVAPGVNINSTAMGGGYGSITGTSAASSYTAGAAALLISANRTSNVDIRHRLRDSAKDLGVAGWDSQYGKGMVNANAAINFSEPPDRTAPVTGISLSGTLGNNGWYRSDVVVALTAADKTGGSGVGAIKYSLDGGSAWLTYSSPLTISAQGATLILARSWDKAGNDEGPPAFREVKIDKTPPSATTIYLFGTKGGNGWYTSNVGVEFEGIDNPGGSGMAGIEYSLNGGSTWLSYFSQVSVTTEGVTTVLARNIDNAGNMESPPASKTFTVDKAAPVTTISLNGTMGVNGWYTSDVTLTLTAIDSSSGVAALEYSLNGGSNWQSYGSPPVISNEGATTVLARALDNSGKVGSASKDVKIDKSAPVTTISLSGTKGGNGLYTSDVTVTLTAADSGSGAATTEYSLNGGGNWQSYALPLVISDEGAATILARTRDNAANLEASPVSSAFKLDKTTPVAATSSRSITESGTVNKQVLAAPTSSSGDNDNTAAISLKGTMGNNDWYLSNVTVTLTAVDTASGVPAIEYSLNEGGNWRTYRLPFTVNDEGITTILARTKNSADNLKAQPVSRAIKIDKTPPVLHESIIQPKITSQKKGTMIKLSYNGKAVDKASGLDKVDTELIDEYGVLSHGLGSGLSGTVTVEAWSDGNNKNRRTYKIQLTATDMAGNRATIDDAATVR